MCSILARPASLAAAGAQLASNSAAVKAACFIAFFDMASSIDRDSFRDTIAGTGRISTSQITRSFMDPSPIRTEISHHTAQATGIQLHYAQAGAGRLMLFLHGFPEFCYASRRQLGEFGRDPRAPAPDMRGYNLSD